MPVCNAARKHALSSAVCVAPPQTKIKSPVAALNRSCVFMLTGDFLLQSLTLLHPRVNLDRNVSAMKIVHSLAHRISQRGLCQKGIVLLQQ